MSIVTDVWPPPLAPIADVLSRQRLIPYLSAAGGDPAGALRLYEWNISISGALYELLAVSEVVLRNALVEQLEIWHGNLVGEWYDDPTSTLSAQAQGDIADARSRVSRLGGRETPGRVVAELNFGFWKFLLASQYETTLWTQHLRNAFPNLTPQRRRTAFEAVEQLGQLRNRIAHLEPIHRRDLRDDMMTACRVIDWVSSDARVWAAASIRVTSVLSLRPTFPTPTDSPSAD